MTINLGTISLALFITCLFPARATRAGNILSLSPHDAAASFDAQASRASKRRRHSRASRKTARSRRHSSASQPAQQSQGTSTDIQPATRDDAEENGRMPAPTPTPSLEQQFPKTYKIKKP
jgi:hypothetical protein